MLGTSYGYLGSIVVGGMNERKKNVQQIARMYIYDMHMMSLSFLAAMFCSKVVHM